MALAKNVRAAVMAVLTADSTLQTLLGGAGRITRFQPPKTEQLPSLTYYLSDRRPGSMQQHTVYIQFDVWTTSQSGSIGTGDDVLERVNTLLTQPALLAAIPSVDATVFRERGPMDLPSGMDAVIRQMSEYRFTVN